MNKAELIINGVDIQQFAYQAASVAQSLIEYTSNDNSDSAEVGSAKANAHVLLYMSRNILNLNPNSKKGSPL